MSDIEEVSLVVPVINPVEIVDAQNVDHSVDIELPNVENQDAPVSKSKSGWLERSISWTHNICSKAQVLSLFQRSREDARNRRFGRITRAHRNNTAIVAQKSTVKCNENNHRAAIENYEIIRNVDELSAANDRLRANDVDKLEVRLKLEAAINEFNSQLIDAISSGDDKQADYLRGRIKLLKEMECPKPQYLPVVWSGRPISGYDVSNEMVDLAESDSLMSG